MRDNLLKACLTRNCWQAAPEGEAYCASCRALRAQIDPDEVSSGSWFANLPANRAHYAVVSAALLKHHQHRMRRRLIGSGAILAGTVLLLTGVLVREALCVACALIAYAVAASTEDT